MARKSFDSVNADYVRLKLKCNCGRELVTDMIPVRERYDLDKDINNFVHSKPVVCDYCKSKYTLHFYDNQYCAYCTISELNDDNDIIYLHEIPFENVMDNNDAIKNYIIEIVNIKDFIEGVNDQDVLEKDILYRMAFSYLISIMDAYLHNTFVYNISHYKVFEVNFLRRTNRKSKIGDILKKLESKSFQNLEVTAIPYYRQAFNIDIPENCIIQNATHIRNTIIHNNSREKDGYEHHISVKDVIELKDEVEKIVKYVNEKIEEAIFEEVTLSNLRKKNYI